MQLPREQTAVGDAGMAEQADAGDLKSPDRNGRAGSIPAPGTSKIAALF